MKIITNAENIANYFLQKESMSAKKINKLVYYAYVWTLVLKNKDINNLDTKLFSDRIEAWVHGPIIPKVFDKYSGHLYAEKEDCDYICDDKNIVEILESVWDVYKRLNDYKLEYISIKEEPWRIARGHLHPTDPSNELISDEEIYKYFSKKMSTNEKKYVIIIS